MMNKYIIALLLMAFGLLVPCSSYAQLPAITDSATSQTAVGDTAEVYGETYGDTASDVVMGQNLRQQIPDIVANASLPVTNAFNIVLGDAEFPRWLNVLGNVFTPFKGWEIIGKVANGFGLEDSSLSDNSNWVLYGLLPCIAVGILTFVFINSDRRRMPPLPGTVAAYVRRNAAADIEWAGYLLASSFLFDIIGGYVACAIMLAISVTRYIKTVK